MGCFDLPVEVIFSTRPFPRPAVPSPEQEPVHRRALQSPPGDVYGHDLCAVDVVLDETGWLARHAGVGA